MYQYISLKLFDQFETSFSNQSLQSWKYNAYHCVLWTSIEHGGAVVWLETCWHQYTGPEWNRLPWEAFWPKVQSTFPCTAWQSCHTLWQSLQRSADCTQTSGHSRSRPSPGFPGEWSPPPSWPVHTKHTQWWILLASVLLQHSKGHSRKGYKITQINIATF